MSGTEVEDVYMCGGGKKEGPKDESEAKLALRQHAIYWERPGQLTSDTKKGRYARREVLDGEELSVILCYLLVHFVSPFLMPPL